MTYFHDTRFTNYGCGLAVVLLGVCLLFSTGCGSEKDPRARHLVPARGTITIDGAPLGGATIIFAPTENNQFSVQSATMSDQNGRFELTTFLPGDGIHPGNYNVTVFKDETFNSVSDEEIARMEASGRGVSYDIITRSLIPTRYNSSETSGLTIEIPARGNRNISISLESE